MALTVTSLEIFLYPCITMNLMPMLLQIFHFESISTSSNMASSITGKIFKNSISLIQLNSHKNVSKYVIIQNNFYHHVLLQ